LALLALLTGLSLLARLPLLACLPLLGLLTGIREVPPRVLELRSRGGQVPVGVDGLVGVLERLPETIEGFLGRGGVALGDALDGVPERLPGRSACLAGRRLLLGQCRGDLATLFLGHAVELLAQVLEILRRDLRITVLVGVRLTGRGPRQRPADRGERRCPLLIGRIEL
jgi:hypothetical protein